MSKLIFDLLLYFYTFLISFLTLIMVCKVFSLKDCFYWNFLVIELYFLVKLYFFDVLRWVKRNFFVLSAISWIHVEIFFNWWGNFFWRSFWLTFHFAKNSSMTTVLLLNSPFSEVYFVESGTLYDQDIGFPNCLDQASPIVLKVPIFFFLNLQ